MPDTDDLCCHSSEVASIRLARRVSRLTLWIGSPPFSGGSHPWSGSPPGSAHHPSAAAYTPGAAHPREPAVSSTKSPWTIIKVIREDANE